MELATTFYSSNPKKCDISQYLTSFIDSKMIKNILFVTIATCASAIELTPANWDSETAGKVVFLKMFAPWCGHCKAMKPDWDSLMAEYESSENILVADVDCVGDGKDLCDKAGVKGFPTIKWGDPENLSPYEGGRDLAGLKSFAASLKVPCNVETLENCDDQEKTLIKELESSTATEITASVDKYNQEMLDIDSTFKERVQKLQATYQELVGEKDQKKDKLASSTNIAVLKQMKNAKEDKNEL
jgi:protein disulfide-isomerase-like protein|tara:strand:+ start:1685 stop:2413 length:729 start_codon:yes stop_codon:yes gene_type:complete